MSTLNKVFRLFLAFVLAFSLLAPSLMTASANMQPSITVKINPNSDEREITSAKIVFSDERNYDTAYPQNWEKQDEVTFHSAANMVEHANGPLALYIFVRYEEKGETIHYYDKKIVTKDEMLNLTEITLDNEVVTQTLNQFKPAEDQYENVRVIFANQGSYMTGMEDVHFTNGNAILAKPTNSQFDLKYYLTTITKGESYKSFNTVVSNVIDFKTPVSFEDDFANTVELNLNGEVQNLGVLPLKNSPIGITQPVRISPGTYDITYRLDETSWIGNMEVTSDTSYKLPSVSEQLEINLNNVYNSTDEVQLNVAVERKAGTFKEQLDKTYNATAHLMRNGKVVNSQDFTHYSNGYINWDMSLQVSGEYELYIEEYLGDTLTKSNTVAFNYESKWEALKGTVFTVIGDDENNVKGGYLDVYTEQGSNVTKIQPNNEGIFFIPNTLLLKDQEYIAAYQNADSKIAYTKKFVGLVDTVITLTPDQLKPISFEPKGYTNESSISVVANNGARILDNINGWNAAVEGPFVVTWAGIKDNTHSSFEIYTEDLESLDVEALTWNTYRVTDFVDRGKFSKYDGADFLQFDTIRFANEGNYISENFHLDFYKDGVPYVQAYLNAYNLPETTELYNPKVLVGSAGYSPYKQLIETTFANEYFSSVFFNTEVQLSYVLTAEDGTEWTLTSNNLSSIKIPADVMEQLNKGTYTLRLVSHNVDPEVMNLTMDSYPIYIQAIDQTDSNGAYLPTKISVNNVESYTQTAIENGMNVNISILSEKYGTVGYYYSRNNSLVADLNSSYRPIEAEETYLVNTTVSFYNMNEFIVDQKKMTGAEILALENISISNDLQKSTITASDLTNDEHALLFISNVENKMNEFTVNVRAYKNSVTVYSKPGSYNVEALIDSDTAYKVYPIQKIELGGGNTNEIKQGELYPISIVDNGKKLPISNVYLLSNRSIGYEVKSRNEIYYPKGTYERIIFNALKEREYESDWSYAFTQNNITIDGPKQFDIDTDNIQIVKNAFTFNEQNRTLNVSYNLVNDQIKYSGISKGNGSNWYDFSNHFEYEIKMIDGQPVRVLDVEGSDLQRVTPILKLKNAKNEVVYETTENRYGTGYMNLYIPSYIANGTYTAEIIVPTAPKKTAVLTETIVIGVEDTEYVTITSPNNGHTNALSTIDVAGKAYENATVTVNAVNAAGEIVQTKSAKATADGNFATSFAKLPEGNYTIVAINGSKKSSVSVTIDQTPPAKASNIKFESVEAGLKVTWSADADADSFKVIVQENGKEKLVAETTAKEYTIPSIVAGATYSVVIEAFDTLGNKSVSDAVTFEVPSFVVTEVNVEDKRNTSGFLTIGDKLAVTVKGSYAEGFTANATVAIGEETKAVQLNYNADTSSYEGTFTVAEGMQEITMISAVIINGNEKTETATKALNYKVGATVTGSVTDGSAVADATVRLRGQKYSYSVKTAADGTFTFAGLGADTYNVESTFNGVTKKQGTVTVTNGQELKDQTLTIDATSTIEEITVAIKDEKNASPLNGLSASVKNNATNFVAYGYLNEGKFIPYNKDALKNIKTGSYTFVVQAFGKYAALNETFDVTKTSKNFNFSVNKIAEGKTVTLEISGIAEADEAKYGYISLHSYNVASKYNYQLGNYTVHDATVKNGTIEIQDVVPSDDYYLSVYKDGYLYYSEPVTITGEHTFKVEIDKGRTVSGTIQYGESGVGGVNVWTYTDNVYSSAVTDANGHFTLTGVSGEAGEIQVNTTGFLSVAPIALAKGTEDVALAKISLEKAASVDGTVKDKDGNPIQYANITISDDQNSFWGRTAKDGSFSVSGLIADKEYTIVVSAYPYPTVVGTVMGGELNQEVILQLPGKGSFAGEGNFMTASKSTVAPGEEIQYTVNYQNNGTAESKDVPVHITLPEALQLQASTVLVNGKQAVVNGNVVTIPTVAEGEAGKVTFKATVKAGTSAPSILAQAKITAEGEVLTAASSVVFLSIEAPSTTATANIKVYGSAQHGSIVDIFANGKLVATTKVDSKWWFADVKLPVAKADEDEQIQLTAIAKLDGKVANAQPLTINYSPNIPQITDVKISAGWNGDVKLNPYTGIATFAITEHTNMPTTIKFSEKVDEAYIVFLDEKYKLTEQADGSYKYNGVFGENGLWTSYGEQILAVEFTLGDVTVTLPLMNIIVLIDPSGYVFEDSMDNRLEGVKAVVEVQNADGSWVPWNAEFYGQVNPQTTDVDGRYGWDVIAGKWRVIFSKDGYETYISRVMDVPPAELELNIPMIKTSNPTATEPTVNGNAVTISFDRYMNVGTIQATLTDKDGNEVDATVEYEAINGYKSIPFGETGRTAGFAGEGSKDNKGQDGFFMEDETLKLANAITIKPTAKLVGGEQYTVTLKGTIEDTSERTLGDDVTTTFTAVGETTGGEDNGNGNGGNNGGSNPGNGGGTTPSPAPGGGSTPAPTPTPDPQEVTVDASNINNQLSKEEVVVEAPAVTAENPTVDVAVSKEAVEELVKNNKDLTVKVGDINVVVPAAVFKQAGNNPVELTVGLSNAKLPTSTTLNTVSETYTFNFSANGKAVTTFDQPIEIKVPLKKNVKEASKVAAFYVNKAENRFEFVVSKYENGNVIFKTKHFSDYVVLEGDKTFVDVQTHWAKAIIEELASKTIINGKTDTAFEPEATITRAEFAALVTRALNLPKPAFKGTFKDIQDAKAWYAQDVEAAVAAKIVNGMGDGTFNPDANVTREQMATMIVRAIEYMNAQSIPAKTDGITFVDANKMSDYAVKNINIASTLGIINGVEENGVRNFKPSDFAKRAEAAKMLAELLKNL